ncbi:endonuclease MutS2 [Sphaerobacter sp.]|uniref:endonuclease MutS2 n=1 Tax=Sphaerobacter sp. TaxID=2099654 RepID=UPI001DA66301|nr:endonuclease MutS2 [Sphaerobacter sp.]MBX5444793.1 endonuclease MutS2 [Sphaerobacter sp.]
MSYEASRQLEFDRVLEILAQRCQYSVAAERALEIGPSGDASRVAYLLAVTREAVTLLTNFPSFTVGGVRDIRPVVERARRGSLLSAGELRDALDTIQAARELRRTFFKLPNANELYPNLSEFVEAIADLAGLEADLARTVGPRGEILDTASERLAEIRREVRIAHRRLLDRLNRMLTDAAYAGAIQDAIVTMREGRYVIPVRADRRAQIPGVVHATSASGQTLFVEPMAVVELNNRWRELQMAEEHEVEAILRARSEQIAAAADDLDQTVEAVAAIDLALAKARLAFSMRAVEPILVEASGPGAPGGHPRHRIDLRQARHPLLDPDTVVPIDVRIGETYRILVVTGPNTGGKTVALKTVGLMTLMAQTGLFIPAADGSALSVFSAVYADIGDEQSIEQSLSTFSAHVTKIIAMLRSADADSLVLLDEIGAGTDPQEGSALARAIIAALLERGVIAMVTTHYSELKAFAYVTEGTENASVEFDLRTLSPTYRLLLGVAGQSNALAIAERLGMPREVIDTARSYLTPGTERADELLTEIRRRRAEAEKALAAARDQQRAAERARREAEEALREAERARAAARDDALAELAEELREARDLLRRLRARAEAPVVPAVPAERPASQEVEELGEEVRRAQERVRQAARRRRPRTAPAEPLRVGDTVEIPSLGMEGEIVGFADGGEEADVQVGAFKVRQPVAALRRVRSAPAPRQATRVSVPAAPSVDQEINLLGKRVAEAQEELEVYLDAAARASLPWVRIVHGKGTGALRAAVQEMLRRHPLVERFETAEPNAGGDGVTVAFLKG